jgi:hypothetical protein
MAEMILEPEVIDLPEIDISHIETEDDTPVDNIFSEKQQRLLTESLYTSWQAPVEAGSSFVALANVGLFYGVHDPPVVPDVMVSLDVTTPADVWPKQNRSYFVWEYGKFPEVVVEIVSNRKGGELDSKKALYARLGIGYYIVYDPGNFLSDTELHIFERRGSGYVPFDQQWLPLLGLGLTLWEGVYEGLAAVWLRWCDEQGDLIMTGYEASLKAQQQAEAERQRAEAERQRAEKLAAQLRALGVEPDDR